MCHLTPFQDGRITDVKVFSDCLFPQLVDALAKEMKGVSYDAYAVIFIVDRSEAEPETASQQPAQELATLYAELVAKVASTSYCPGY